MDIFIINVNFGPNNRALELEHYLAWLYIEFVGLIVKNGLNF